MIYKRYELALSLNGDQIMHIARNASGVVVFRKESEKALKKAIDDYIKEIQYQEELVEQKKLEKETKRNRQEETIETLGDEEESLMPQKRVTRGSDGKFISKSQLDSDEEDQKKTFWDKLTS